ncbi:hypothetical protein ACIRU3_26390 [Streptomyces sp. NPDC101151]|uniref:hypothetical protein n=1 Tax=Streptomyces sp. NPDC101151 TaxID=3366115 RepID=UPI00380E6768
MRGAIRRPDPQRPPADPRDKTEGSFGYGGIIILEQSDSGDDPASRVRLIQQNPPEYEHRRVVSLTATIDCPEQDKVTLVSKQPPVLLGRPTRFPPQGDYYKLENPVDFVHPDHRHRPPGHLPRQDRRPPAAPAGAAR